MSGSTTLLWIVIGILLIAVIALAWRLWHAERSAAADTSRDAGRAANAGSEAPGETEPPRRSSVPPPAWAGKQPADTTPAMPPGGRATPPPSRAGGVVATSGGGDQARNAGEADTYRTARPRHSKPPPALAGRVPGVTPTPPSVAARPRSGGARPPAASAGGTRGNDDPSDKEPASSGRVPSRRYDKANEPSLASITNWGYQLQDLKLDVAAQSTFDLLVIDYSQDGSDEEALTRKELTRLKRKPDGGRRFVYAYISVGEAESYRYYWERSWRKTPPAWLIAENPDWKENYYVRFWDPAWQEIIWGGDDSYIARIAEAGFDGLYLDRCDVHEELAENHAKVARERGDIEKDMVAFVCKLSAEVRSQYPGLGIIMQNAETLLEHPQVLSAIDGMAKEELLFGLSRVEKRNTAEEVAESRALLDKARGAGLPVMAVEYLDKDDLRLEASGTLRAMGFIPYMAAKNRELDKLETDQPEPAVA